jgi:DNA replication initiation complex subunit (GINS family)
LYTALLERWQAEREAPTLLPLRDSFLQNLRSYIEKVLDLSQSEEKTSLQRQLFATELANLRFMVNDLLQIRVRKIFSHIPHQEIDFDLLTRNERRFVEQITRNIRSVFMTTDDLFSPIENGDSSTLLLIRFLADHPQLVGVDLKTYGPFRADDLAMLPAENARLMIRKNQAEPVRIGELHNEGAKKH